MPRYRIGYSEATSGYYYFDAENPEEAQKFIDEVDTGMRWLSELPNLYKKILDDEHFWVSYVEVVE